MGLFNFVKDAGEKLWDAVTGQHDKDDQAKKVQEHLSKTGIPDADKVNIQIADGKATVTGDGLSQEAKEKILVAAVGGSPCELTKSFFRLVLKEGRESVIQFMANSYITLYRKKKNIIRGKLTTAVAVSPIAEQKLLQMVEDKTNGAVEFETEINNDIIGGFILEYDTYRMDASVKSKLKNILSQLKV